MNHILRIGVRVLLLMLVRRWIFRKRALGGRPGDLEVIEDRDGRRRVYWIVDVDEKQGRLIVFQRCCF